RGEGSECTGAGTLAEYVLFRNDPPPIGAILDVVLPTWDGAIQPCNGSRYRTLFSKIEVRLRSIARDQSRTVTLDASILTPEFAQVRKQSETQGNAPQVNAPQVDASQVNASQVLPPEVQDWVSREGTRIKDQAQARALFNTFLLLSVLGAFGALIFLIR